MAPSAAEIDSLIASGPKKSSIPQLEAFLEAQLSGSQVYHGKSLRTLIKLYQLFSAGNTEKITQACFLSLLEFPNNSDLLAMTYMIPTSTQNTEPLASIVTCQTQLEACQFVEFWKTFATVQSDGSISGSSVAKSSVPRLQTAILSVLALTYRTAPLAVVLESLNATGQLPSNSGVASVNGDTVTFTAEQQQQQQESQREKAYLQNTVTFPAIHSLMSKMKA